MSEAIKAVIWKKENQKINGKKVYKYLIGAILITDEPIDGITSGDNVIMEEIEGENDLTGILSRATKYKPPHILGDLSTAMLDIADLTPDDMINDYE